MPASMLDRIYDRLGLPPDGPALSVGSPEHRALTRTLIRIGKVGAVNMTAFAAAFAYFGAWWAAGASLFAAGWARLWMREGPLSGDMVRNSEIFFVGATSHQIVVHVSLGGFQTSAMYFIWTVLSMSGMAIILRTRRRFAWLATFMLLTAGLGVAEQFIRLDAPPLPMWFESYMFANNTGLLGVMSFMLLDYYLVRLDDEKRRSEELLLNILPQPIADRLKQDKGAIADAVPDASVLFSDIVGFTKLSSQVTPAELVAILNEIFSRFDALADRHGVEKIKTIGDAYMAVAGLPVAREDHAAAIAAMALDMRDAMIDLRRELDADIRIRIGIHTGPVVAGVIGARKFAHDLWGDTVNVASRMESHGVAGAVQCSDDPRQMLGDQFAFESRGEIDIKGKGPMRTYLVERVDVS